jgi:hypothetical protein
MMGLLLLSVLSALSKVPKMLKVHPAENLMKKVGEHLEAGVLGSGHKVSKDPLISQSFPDGFPSI